jgi:hypothetical protein
MKNFNTVITTLLVAAGLVASFAFTSKTVNIVDFQYTAAKRTIQTGQSFSIVPSELIADATPLTTDQLDKWSSGLVSHSAGTKLAYIEYDKDLVGNLTNAATAVKDYYVTNSTLPEDGKYINCCPTCIITIFRN